MPEVVESEPTWIVCGDDSRFDRCWAEIVFHKHVCCPRFPTAQLETGKDPVLRLRVGGLVSPSLHELRKQRVHRNGSLGRFALGRPDLCTCPRAPDMNEGVVEVHVPPLQPQALEMRSPVLAASSVSVRSGSGRSTKTAKACSGLRITAS